MEDNIDNINSQIESPQFISINCPIFELEISNYFNKLEKHMKEYAFYLTRACWTGSRINYF